MHWLFVIFYDLKTLFSKIIYHTVPDQSKLEVTKKSDFCMYWIEKIITSFMFLLSLSFSLIFLLSLFLLLSLPPSYVYFSNVFISLSNVKLWQCTIHYSTPVHLVCSSSLLGAKIRCWVGETWGNKPSPWCWGIYQTADSKLMPIWIQTFNVFRVERLTCNSNTEVNFPFLFFLHQN